jgi:dihydropyrimidine dehydrogenase (NADP+)
LKTSLQANIYCLGKKELYEKGWRGQVPPYEFDKLGKKIDPTPVKTSNYLQLVGTKLKHISPIDKMTKEEFLIPKINDEHCLQCGRCFLACADSGYQAIKFDGYNTFPKIVEEDCTGCAICHAVCPVQDAIHMVPRTMVYEKNFGMQPGPNFPKEHIIRVEPISKQGQI